MKSYRIFAAVILCAGVATLAAAPVRAQINGDSSAAPVIVKQRPVKAEWLRAEVIHADQTTMIVREAGNEMKIHTFTYADKAKDKMSNILEQGGYQSGDHVKIRWIPGTSEALDIKGKPSPAI
ncbi:MAG TPA: hypothetical protein VJ228_03775 [Candidatus Acidoferrales bacterium]|jgi:hypothetical protein|nr:hypothetical protein [Candidatus Acidoferrales bacterium]